MMMVFDDGGVESFEPSFFSSDSDKNFRISKDFAMRSQIFNPTNNSCRTQPHISHPNKCSLRPSDLPRIHADDEAPHDEAWRNLHLNLPSYSNLYACRRYSCESKKGLLCYDHSYSESDRPSVHVSCQNSNLKFEALALNGLRQYFLKPIICLTEFILRNSCVFAFHDKLKDTLIALYRQVSIAQWLTRKWAHSLLLLLLLLMAPTSSTSLPTGGGCPKNCTCSTVPSPNLTSHKWASLIPSATPTLLTSFINQKSRYVGSLPFILHPKLIHNFTKLFHHTKLQPQPSPSVALREQSSHRQGDRKRKRDIRHFGHTQRSSPMREKIIELNPSYQSASDEKNDGRSFENVDFDSVHKQMLDNRRQRISSERSRGQRGHIHQVNDPAAGNFVPEIIKEQIPDLYDTVVFPKRKVEEENEWMGSPANDDEKNSTTDNETNLYLAMMVAMVCDTGGYVTVPRGDINFYHSSVISLNLNYNNLTNLSNNSLAAYTNLRYLFVRQNGLCLIEQSAFEAQPDMDTLDLSENLLSSVPAAILSCSQLRLLLLAENVITYVQERAFQGLQFLQWVDLRGNPLLTVHHRAFSNLPSLNKLILKETRDLSTLPDLLASVRLEVLGIDRASLASVPHDFCLRHPRLRSLNLHLNALQVLPDLSKCNQLKLLDLSNNAISELSEGAFRDTALLQDLLLQHNRIETVPQGAFVGLHQLQVLNLEHNLISFLHPDTFLPLHNIEDLNLGNNVFPELPSRGLEHVLHLKVHNNRHLRQFPGPQSFPAVLSLVLSYAYHCCPFLNLDVATDTARLGSENTSRAQTPQLIHEDVVFSLEGLQRHDPRLWNHTHAFWPYYPVHPSSNFTALWANLAGRYPAAGTASSANSTNASTKHEGSELHTIASSTPRYPEEPFYVPGDFSKTWLELSGAGSMMGEDELRNQHSIQCIPQPGPFMPCRDLFDWWTLRCGVWLVFLLALMGNGVVVVVLIAAYAKMDVPRFLVTNLAMADFLMGVYLGFLAVVDASTLGEFRMYAIPWQMSAGCQLAGFLGVLSSELSVYTLTVITLERNYAIIHAMNLNKRLSLRHAAYIMAIGWIFALTMAVLPLTGVSDYRKFAVCLPFETDGAGLGYVVFLMVINGVAFMILMGCYLKIYCAIRGSQAWNSNDSRIAKRMALLVFTDFICWAPIAFFSLSAAYGLQLISLEEAKVFTVFVLPLNSCCNPFLYALLTKQFKKDCVMLCKAIEESRVTRGIGRCRHSSNFSNRQTPVNTNSALDSKSRDTCSCGAAEKRRSRPTQFIDFICCRKTRLSAGTYSKGHRRNLSPKKEVGRSNAASANWSWRGGWRSTQKPGPLRLLDLRKPASLDLTRKSSQESSLSSSRHDSSSASTATWRVSRSSVSSDASKTDSASRPGSQREDSRAGNTSRNPSRGGGGGKPRLQRQRAIEKDTQGISRLNCPVHHREELSCVYEQASIEEAAEIKMNPSPRFAHRRSLSDGLLFCTITATQPISGVQPNPAALLVRSPTVLPTTILPSTPEIEKQDSVSQDSDTDKPRLLETHFPLDNDNGDGVPKEASPLL